MFAWTKLWRRGRDRCTRSVEALSRAIVPVVEAMEARRFFTACSLSSGTLTVTGDSVNDFIEVQDVGTDIKVLDDSVQVCLYTESSVTAIVVNGLNGDDDLCIENVSTSIPITLNGGAGNDTLKGGAGGETMNGEGGNDAFWGHGGADSLSGGSDSDTFISQDGDGADTISGGDQLDTMDYREKTGNLTVTVGSGANDGASGEGDDVQGDVETVLGGEGNDHITGDGSDELLNGFIGNDTLVGGGGADTLNGGDGTDTADYSARSDNLKITLDGISNDGNETLGEGDNVVDVQIVIGGSGNDTITGDANANTLLGSGGTDSLVGQSGADSIDGGANGDTIYGNAGADTLRGGGSTDTIYAGTGNDHVYGYGVLNGDEDDDIFYALNNFKDTINGGTGNDTLANYDTDDLDDPISIEVIL